MWYLNPSHAVHFGKQIVESRWLTVGIPQILTSLIKLNITALPMICQKYITHVVAYLERIIVLIHERL
jgi:hypothetical protein